MSRKSVVRVLSDKQRTNAPVMQPVIITLGIVEEKAGNRMRLYFSFSLLSRHENLTCGAELKVCIVKCCRKIVFVIRVDHGEENVVHLSTERSEIVPSTVDFVLSVLENHRVHPFSFTHVKEHVGNCRAVLVAHSDSNNLFEQGSVDKDVGVFDEEGER
jgi:hypothetical protein